MDEWKILMQVTDIMSREGCLPPMRGLVMLVMRANHTESLALVAIRTQLVQAGEPSRDEAAQRRTFRYHRRL